MGVTQIVLAVLLCTLFLCNGTEHEHEHDHDHGGTVDPYHEILRFYNLQDEQNFTVAFLEEVFHDFTAMIHCEEEHHESHEEETEACADNLCINATIFLTSLGHDNVTYITEPTFEEISLILLEIGISFNDSCHHELLPTQDKLTAYRNSIIDRFSGGSANLQLVPLQESLELLDLGDEEHHNETDSDYAHDHEHEHDEEAEDHHDEDEHHISVFAEKCLGADTVFDQLGFHLEDDVTLDNAGKVAALVVYHILNGAHISRDCRILPRREFFFNELVHMHGSGNETLGREGFSEVMEALQIGELHHDSHNDEGTDDGHDHRRKRDTETDLFHKSSWETSCYTDEQLLAIFMAEDSDIPAETFQEICPALIQQKLSGVCETSEDESHTTRPSTAERYGYGSLATIIVCLCSVVGAFVIKFASDKAYDIIMALFLGLAVGTLYTDALVHLLPSALGVHAHSGEDDHDHGGDGIVVESFVWYSLVSVGALYAFYLFEKTMVLVRGDHAHSHGMSSFSDRENEIQMSKADQYQVSMKDPSYDEVKPKRSISNVALMVLMGDAVHNFADGLAIGASFSTSTAVGISTAIAVFCHELPHELGDFAILLASGISFTRALLLNVLVSLTAMVGLYVGLVLSSDETVSQWIVAAAAGLFIYISLVDMMPKLLQRTSHGMRDFFLNNVGILIGAGIMIILAILESKIRVTL